MAFAPTASPQPTTFTYRSAVTFDELGRAGMFHNARWPLHVERAATARFIANRRRYSTPATVRTREWTLAFRDEQAAITPGRGAA